MMVDVLGPIALFVLISVYFAAYLTAIAALPFILTWIIRQTVRLVYTLIR
jgi:hypothetical protein